MILRHHCGLALLLMLAYSATTAHSDVLGRRPSFTSKYDAHARATVVPKAAARARSCSSKRRVCASPARLAVFRVVFENVFEGRGGCKKSATRSEILASASFSLLNDLRFCSCCKRDRCVKIDIPNCCFFLAETRLKRQALDPIPHLDQLIHHLIYKVPILLDESVVASEKVLRGTVAKRVSQVRPLFDTSFSPQKGRSVAFVQVVSYYLHKKHPKKPLKSGQAAVPFVKSTTSH